MGLPRIAVVAVILVGVAGAVSASAAPKAHMLVRDGLHAKPGWALAAVMPGKMSCLIRLSNAFEYATYGVSGRTFLAVENGRTGCVLRTFSISSSRRLQEVSVPGLHVATMEEGPVRGVGVEGSHLVFPAATGVNLTGHQFLVVVDLKTHATSRVRLPGGLRLSDYPATVPGGLAFYAGRGRVTIFQPKRATFRTISRLRMSRASLIYVPSYGLVAWNLRGTVQRLTNAKLAPVRSVPRRLPDRIMFYGLRAANVDHRPSLVYEVDRREVAGAARNPSTEIVAYDLIRHCLVWRKQFDFHAAPWFGVSPRGRTLCLADLTHHRMVLYSMRSGHSFYTPLSHVIGGTSLRVFSVRP